jgi:predicted signal transduction protein with EAL and GGDEF domain
LLTIGEFRPIVPAAAVLAGAAVAASMLRTALSFRELRTLAETRRQPATDDLTDLPNRRAFARGLREAIERAAARGETLAVMVIDLDHFKELNDTLGHHAGDLVLEQVGPRLRSALRAQDLLLKVDRAFVRDVATDPADAAIVQAITALGQRLGIAVIAEGVENVDALERLKAFEADGVQGFHFTPALPPDRLAAWLTERRLPMAA